MSRLHHLHRQEADTSGQEADRLSAPLKAERERAMAGGWQPSTRYSDQPMSWRMRMFGMGGVGTVALLVAGGALFTWTTYPATPAPSALTVFNVMPPASPPETPRQEKEAPKPVEKKETQPEPVRVPQEQPPKMPISRATMPMPQPETKAADPAPPQPETAAPKTMPAPPAPQLSSDGLDTWEGRVLAALHKQRRYPRAAMMQRQQGIPYIRFIMDREGKVLSIRLERSCGFPELDREAVALAKRASPLPKPPDDKPGDTLELVVPIEYFLRPR
ncbi:energy transducer TonB [Sphingobium cloacae]|uniref:TonB family protein n=1 Tax=Sphingobium cloacae TaxID=120107 RepID=A0A1E1F0V0_9SPHN|nr:energy transducer TonB [Sphingobium cloacae]BAV64082.1 TonB family protein [Sphingobium cloacae]